MQFGVEIPSEHIIPEQDISTEDVDLDGTPPREVTRQSTDWIVTLTPEKTE